MITFTIVVFVLGYLAIALEHPIKINKAASALLTGVICWVLVIFYLKDRHETLISLSEHLGSIAGILFFLLGAMTIVELIDAHDGFDIITARIKTKNKKKLIWIISIVTFFLSAVLDNLTTTIVMVTLIRKLVPDKKERLLTAGLVVIAANAGGAWSPIGDVTTTMLWIGGQVTALNIVKMLFLPSVACLIVPVLAVSQRMKGKIEAPDNVGVETKTNGDRDKNIVLFTGIGLLIFVPVFKTITHLPPYMGMLLALGLLWIITEIIHSGKDDEDKSMLSVVYALRKIDASSILFFLGILLAVSSLETLGVLTDLANYLTKTIASDKMIVILIGLLSSIVDNVPLVAATMGMYNLNMYPTDHYFWEFIAYCAGTGGSALIIGSAAGVAAMGLEKIEFIWYLKNISWLALIGYFAGVIVYLFQVSLLI